MLQQRVQGYRIESHDRSTTEHGCFLYPGQVFGARLCCTDSLPSRSQSRGSRQVDLDRPPVDPRLVQHDLGEPGQIVLLSQLRPPVNPVRAAIETVVTGTYRIYDVIPRQYEQLSKFEYRSSDPPMRARPGRLILNEDSTQFTRMATLGTKIGKQPAGRSGSEVLFIRAFTVVLNE